VTVDACTTLVRRRGPRGRARASHWRKQQRGPTGRQPAGTSTSPTSEVRPRAVLTIIDIHSNDYTFRLSLYATPASTPAHRSPSRHTCVSCASRQSTREPRPRDQTRPGNRNTTIDPSGTGPTNRINASSTTDLGSDLGAVRGAVALAVAARRQPVRNAQTRKTRGRRRARGRAREGAEPGRQRRGGASDTQREPGR
jgi:hypothetical protein